MDLEVAGRHALLFDDDTLAAFVNSGDALVEWHSLQIDRYDVRHLLSSPPPPRRRNRNIEAKPSDEFLIDQERYLHLPPDSVEPEIEVAETPSGGDGYHSVAFSYGNTDDSADIKNTAGGMESSGYIPPFAVPGDIVQSLAPSVPLMSWQRAVQPPTEKVHQIIARTAMFVSKHGGQSEIVLRVKQGDNPTFGFLMPDHHLHAYFRYLVEHPELLLTEFDEKSQDQIKRPGEHDKSNSVGEALSLLGSVYGSGEDEDGDAVIEKVEAMENAAKDDPVSRKPILSNKENVSAVKKNSSIVAPKSKSVKGNKKEGNSSLLSTAEEKWKNNVTGAILQPPILEPPPEMKRLIDKLVEFVMRNGKQFEATLLEQDRKHEKFPFLLPPNQYHPYYLKALQAAQESKANGMSFNSGNDDQGGRGIISKKALTNGWSYSSSDFDDVPFESDRKEKFKMVIGKSMKDGQELDKGTADSGVTVDAAAAAAILQAATRGIKNSDSHNHLSRSEGEQFIGGTDSSDVSLTEEQKRKAERLKKAKMFVAMLKSGAVPTKAGTSRGPSVEPVEPGGSRPASEVYLTNQEREGSLPPAVVYKPPTTGNLSEKQSERLSKRKYRSKLGGFEDGKEDGQREEHEDDHMRRKYRSRSRRDEDENAVERKHCRGKGRHGSHSSEENKSGGESSEEDSDHRHSKLMRLSHHSQQEQERDEEHNKHHSKRKHRSRSSRHEEDDRVRNAVEKERRHRKRRHRSYSSEKSEDKESCESDREHKHLEKTHHERRSRRRHGSRSRRHGDGSKIENSYEEKNSEAERGENDGSEDVYNKENDCRRSSKHRHSHHSSERSKKHRSSRSSHHSRDKHQHRHAHSSRDESLAQHKHGSSSDDEVRRHASSPQPEKEFHEERDELEEGEISSKVSEESRGNTIAGKRGSSVDVMFSSQRAPSQPSDATEIPDDLRAKIRAMLMATRS